MALLPAAPASLPTAYLTDERLAMRDAVRSFAMNEVLPRRQRARSGARADPRRRS